MKNEETNYEACVDKSGSTGTIQLLECQQEKQLDAVFSNDYTERLH